MAATNTPGVRTRSVEYEYEGTKLIGYLAHGGVSADARPGVLVFPEWWGLNEHAKARARRLAELGYVALAADVYGGGVVTDAFPEAARLAADLRQDTAVWRGRARAAFEQLTGQPVVDAARVAAIGHCLDTALQLAYAGADLKAVATFHSALPAPTGAEAGAIRARVLVCLGGSDPFAPEQDIAVFKAALDAAGVALDFVSYPGVVHSFTSPGADRLGNPALRYDKIADADSWERMTALFVAAFGRP